MQAAVSGKYFLEKGLTKFNSKTAYICQTSVTGSDHFVFFMSVFSFCGK